MGIPPGHAIEVRDVRCDELPQASGVLARGMRDNPTCAVIFGHNPQRRETSLQRVRSVAFDVGAFRERICAVDGDAVTGVAVLAPAGTCRRSALQQARMAARLRTLGIRQLARLRGWQAVWRLHDALRAHAHVGALAVDPAHQGIGIGATLLRECIRRLDATGGLGYLQTDRRDHLSFYEAHGFTVTWQSTVFGVPTWSLHRAPGGGPAADISPPGRRLGLVTGAGCGRGPWWGGRAASGWVETRRVRAGRSSSPGR
jgi:GNAT superfamily N-acetyltransferase